MATTISCPDKQSKAVVFQATALAVAVATTDDLLTIPVEHASQMCVYVSNTGAQAVDAFEVKYIFYPGSTAAATVASAAGDYTTPNYPVVAASGDATAIAGAASEWFILDVRGVYSVTFAASSAVGATTLTIEGAAT